MDVNQKPLSWFSIPVADLDRAVRFYSSVFGLELKVLDYQGRAMAFFPMADDQTGGALTPDPDRAGKSGVLVYINGGQDLSQALARVEAAGGRISLGKTGIGEGWGFFAHLFDTEGNEIGVWSPA